MKFTLKTFFHIGLVAEEICYPWGTGPAGERIDGNLPVRRWERDWVNTSFWLRRWLGMLLRLVAHKLAT